MNKVSKIGTLLPTLEGKLVANTGSYTGLGANVFHITYTGVTTIGRHLVEPNGSLLGKLKFSGCDTHLKQRRSRRRTESL